MPSEAYKPNLRIGSKLLVSSEIKPIAEFNKKPEVKELLALLGTGKIDQRSAQAAAWHLANGMSWQELASKRIEHLNGTAELYFHPVEIQRAMQIASVAVAQARAAEREQSRESAEASLSPVAGY